MWLALSFNHYIWLLQKIQSPTPKEEKLNLNASLHHCEFIEASHSRFIFGETTLILLNLLLDFQCPTIFQLV
jgi:hypothetical protein